MNILLYADPHWSQYSSIIRTRGDKYSTRLEQEIQTINWIEQVAIQNNCKEIICLGDFFDKSTLCAEEITALKDISFSKDIQHSFLVGNHEMALNTLEYSSAHIFNLPDCFLFDTPMVWQKTNSLEICYLPYLPDADSQSIMDIFGPKTCKRIIVSHNDIAGIQMGKFVSKTGLKIADIEANCDLFINGHIHNGSEITDRVINLGNVIGQNFNEDAFTYGHHVLILDLHTLQRRYIENPYAFNFYKLNNISESFSVKNNAIVTCRVLEKEAEKARNILDNNSNIIASRLIIENSPERNIDSVPLNNIDHVKQFSQYIIDNIGADEITQFELQEVCK